MPTKKTVNVTFGPLNKSFGTNGILIDGDRRGTIFREMATDYSTGRAKQIVKSVGTHFDYWNEFVRESFPVRRGNVAAALAEAKAYTKKRVTEIFEWMYNSPGNPYRIANPAKRRPAAKKRARNSR